MDKTLSGKYSKIKRRYGEVKKKRAIGFLNLASATAAFNDNLFKFLSIYLLIDLKGPESASDVALLAGVFYVLPFLLFSSISGAIADKFSKQKIIVWMKALEVAIIGFGFYAYAAQLAWGAYACIFLLSLQSAILSPAKYSIIIELVKKEQVPKVNSFMTSWTYLSIILGTFMASFLTQITNRNFVLSLSVCLIASLIGYVASMNIPATKGLGAVIKTKQVPFAQLRETLSMCKKTPNLLLVVVASAFFLFVGAFLQLNLIPFAINSLGMSEVGGGYLFLGTSLGIAAGSIISGRICKKGVHLGISAMSMLAMALLVLMMPVASPSIAGIVVILSLTGLFGGLYQIPLESYMQTYCSPEKRGKVIAAGNFLSFAGVLLAPLSMGFFEKVLGLSPASGFVMLGVILLISSIVLVRNLFFSFVNFVSKGIVHKFYDIYYQNFPYAKKYEEERVAVFAHNLKKRFIFLLFGETLNGHIFLVRKKAGRFDKILSWIKGVEVLTLEEGFTAKSAREKMLGLLTKTRPIFLLDKGVEISDLSEFITALKADYHFHVKEMQLVSRVHFRPSFDHIWQKTSLVFSFNCIKKDALIKEKKPEMQLV